MTFIADLLPAPGLLSDDRADAVLATVAAAIRDSEVAPPEPYGSMVARVRQAAEKIESGANLQRLSELMTLSQFGGVTLGTIAAEACEAPALRPAAEARFAAAFLVASVLRMPSLPHLMPQDLLDRHAVDRRDAGEPAAQPVYDDVLGRVSEASEMDAATGDPHPGLRKFIDRQRRTTRRQVAKIRKSGPASAALGPFDRFAVATEAFLGERLERLRAARRRRG